MVRQRVALLVVDASVWVSAADPTDRFSTQSREFLTALALARAHIRLPAHAYVEVACALARRLGDADRGQRLAARILRWSAVETVSMDASFWKEAVRRGTDLLLRAGDAPYVVVADGVKGELVSWDNELIQRADAVTPDRWLDKRRNPRR